MNDLLRDKIADTLRNAGVFGTYENVADAIIAALSGMVQPLVWRDCAEYSTCLTESDYSIKYWGKEKLWVDRYTTMCRHKTLEAAKAAAQSHYITETLARLGLTPPPTHDTNKS